MSAHFQFIYNQFKQIEYLFTVIYNETHITTYIFFPLKRFCILLYLKIRKELHFSHYICYILTFWSFIKYFLDGAVISLPFHINLRERCCYATILPNLSYFYLFYERDKSGQLFNFLIINRANRRVFSYNFSLYIYLPHL